jgi:hypothetical protein
MTPIPSGEQRVEFTLTDISATERRAVSGNAEHDVPRRFIHRRAAADRLAILREGELGGEEPTVRLEPRRDG